MRVHPVTTWTALVLLAGTAFLGCAGLGKRLEPPEVTLAHIEIVDVQILEMVFRLELRVINTNDTVLKVKGVDCNLVVNGKDFARGVSDTVVEIPPLGTAKVPVVVYSSLVDMFKGLLGAQDQKELNYRMTGRLRLEASGWVPSTVPFSAEGAFSLGGINDSAA